MNAQRQRSDNGQRPGERRYASSEFYRRQREARTDDSGRLVRLIANVLIRAKDSTEQKPKPFEITDCDSFSRHLLSIMEKHTREEIDNVMHEFLAARCWRSAAIHDVMGVCLRAGEDAAVQYLLSYAMRRSLVDKFIFSTALTSSCIAGRMDGAIRFYRQNAGHMTPRCTNALLLWCQKQNDSHTTQGLYAMASELEKTYGRMLLDQHSITLTVSTCYHGGAWDAVEHIAESALKDNRIDATSCSMALTVLRKRRHNRELAERLFADVVEKGHVDAHVVSAMASFHCAIGDRKAAQGVFESELLQPFVNQHTYAKMLEAYAIDKDRMGFEMLFAIAGRRGFLDCRIYGFAMLYYVKYFHDPMKAKALFYDALRKFRQNGFTLDDWFFESAIRAMAMARRDAATKRVFEIAKELGFDSPRVHAEMLQMCSNIGELGYATGELWEKCRTGDFGFGAVMEIINTLYGKRRFRELVTVVDGLPAGLKDTPAVTLKAADALRKSGDIGKALERLGMVKPIGDETEDKRLREKVDIIRGFCLKDSGEKTEAMRLFRRLFNSVGPDARHRTRLLCGIVFCWEDLGYNGGLRDTELRRIYAELKAACSRRLQRQKHEDIEKAIAAIERSGVHGDGLVERPVNKFIN